jgi:hypothetical protein
VQRQVRFNRVPEKVPEKVWEAFVQSQVKFNRVPGQVQQGSREDSGEGLGGFGAKPSQIQQGSGEGSGGLGGSPFLVGISMKYTIHGGIPHIMETPKWMFIHVHLHTPIKQ